MNYIKFGMVIVCLLRSGFIVTSGFVVESNPVVHDYIFYFGSEDRNRVEAFLQELKIQGVQEMLAEKVKIDRELTHLKQELKVVDKAFRIIDPIHHEEIRCLCHLNIDNQAMRLQEERVDLLGKRKLFIVHYGDQLEDRIELLTKKRNKYLDVLKRI